MKVVRCPPLALYLRKILSPCIGNGDLDQSLSVISSHTPRGGLHFRDSSRLLFSMYSKIAEEKDNKMVERWQKDAKAILIFVSPRVRIYTHICLNWSTVGRFILCRRRYATFGNDPRLEAESSASGELGILSQEHMSGSLPPERVMSTPSLPCR
jgi:hypothetical protein